MRIALTGGIGAGKSTVSAYLQRLGATVVDYDAISHGLTAPGGDAIAPIRAAFGANAINPDGSMNRGWVAQHVFAGTPQSNAMRHRLEAIIHPLVYSTAARLDSQAPAGSVIVHDIPLLAEVLDAIPFSFDHIVVVETDDETRIARLMESRGMTRSQASGRIASQSGESARRNLADTIVENNNSIASLQTRLDELWQQWQREMASDAHMPR